jgi:hypothetical protein
MIYTIEQTDDGTWRIVDANGRKVASGLAHSEAWRIADRLSGQPINRAEDL